MEKALAATITEGVKDGATMRERREEEEEVDFERAFISDVIFKVGRTGRIDGSQTNFYIRRRCSIWFVTAT